MVKMGNGTRRYFDRNGKEIVAGSVIKYPTGRVETVYLTNDGELGTDATNKRWIEMGKAAPCEFGIYPLTAAETDEVELV